VSAPASAARVEAQVEVELDGDTHHLPWPVGTPLLEVLSDAGLAAPASCRQGRCGACTCRVTEGRVRLLENQVLDGTDLADGYILACQALPETDRVRVSYDE